MTREELREHCERQIQQFERVEKLMAVTPNDWKRYEEHKLILELLEQEPCCNCIEFKRYAKQMGFKVETQSIPYLMHKEMDIPLLECQKAYDVAIEYLRSQGKLKG